MKSLKKRQQEEKEELNQLISKKENLQEHIDELFKRRDIMQIDFRAQKETLDKQIADAQNQRNEKLESIRLAESGFSELEEIGYERYIPTMLNDDIEHKISKFIANYNKEQGMNMRRCARLGVIVHYIADYFTFPHNNHYPGNVKDHCYYERDLKYGMKAFLKTEEALKIKEQVVAYDSVEELTSYIRSIHNSYMKLAHTVEEDIRYIVHACTTVVKSILNMVSYAFSTSVANIQYV